MGNFEVLLLATLLGVWTNQVLGIGEIISEPEADIHNVIRLKPGQIFFIHFNLPKGKKWTMKNASTHISMVFT